MVDANGKRQGSWVITAGMLQLDSPWTPEQIVWEGNYKDSYRIGTWIEYNQSGDKIKDWILNDDRVLLQIKRYSNSVLIDESNYTFWAILKETTWTMNGQTYPYKYPQEFIQHEGEEKTYYNDGTLWSEMTWKNGRLNGPAKTYYPNGKLCEEGTWYHGYWDMTRPYSFYKK